MCKVVFVTCVVYGWRACSYVVYKQYVSGVCVLCVFLWVVYVKFVCGMCVVYILWYMNGVWSMWFIFCVCEVFVLCMLHVNCSCTVYVTCVLMWFKNNIRRNTCGFYVWGMNVCATLGMLWFVFMCVIFLMFMCYICTVWGLCMRIIVYKWYVCDVCLVCRSYWVLATCLLLYDLCETRC